MDAFLLHALLPELGSLVGGRVRSVEQTDPRTVELALRGAGDPGFLALSCDPEHPRIEPLTRPERPIERGPFARALKAHLQGGTLDGMYQMGFDRAVAMSFTTHRPFSAPRQLTLLIRLFGRRANLYLESTDGALASLKPGVIPRRPGPDVERPRSARRRLDPLATPPPRVRETLGTDPEADLRSVLVQRFTGISPFWAEEILFRAHLEPDLRLADLESWQVDRLWSHLLAWIESVRKGRFCPCVYYDPDRDPQTPIAVTPMPAEHLRGKACRPFESVSAAVSAFYRAVAPASLDRSLRAQVERRYRDQLRRVVRSLDRVAERSRQAAREAEFRRFGELIVSNLSTLRPGKDQLTVIDHYDATRPRIRIPADPAKSPRANAERYFAKARKSQRAKRALAQETARLKARQEALERELASLPTLKADGLHARAAEMGLVSPEGAGSRTPKEESIPFRTFRTRDGWTVWVGRNDRENDLLTYSRAASHDYWFHARGLAGSHVVLRRPDRQQRPSKGTIREAAQIAAYYSKGRSRKTVDVTYTEKRYVRKPKRGKPGLALITNEEVIFVEPKLPEMGTEDSR